MSGLLDTIMFVMFVILLFAFIKGFNRQMIDKHKKKLENQKDDHKDRNHD